MTSTTAPRTSAHAACTHPATKAARAACRRARNGSAPRMSKPRAAKADAPTSKWTMITDLTPFLTFVRIGGDHGIRRVKNTRDMTANMKPFAYAHSVLGFVGADVRTSDR